VTLQDWSICEGLVRAAGDTINCPGVIESMTPMKSGVWGNRLYRVASSLGVHVVKIFADVRDDRYPYPPMPVSATDRARLAAGAQICARATMGDRASMVPRVLVASPLRDAIIMECVSDAEPLIGRLSIGAMPAALPAIAVGLARFHTRNSRGLSEREDLDAGTAMRDYKLHLQYLAASELFAPHARQAVRNVVNRYRDCRSTVVHGDFNSRNILLTASPGHGACIVDFEQCHVGAPIYDVAYIVAELVICAAASSEPLTQHANVRRFVASYLAAAGSTEVDLRDAAIHLSCQILYRFRGPSSNEWTWYVPCEARRRLMRYAIALTCDVHPDASLMDVLSIRL
jgi:hypothetical protein